MTEQQNTQLVLAERPTGPVGNEHFRTVTEPVREPGRGEIVVRTEWLAFDPAQRGWLNDIRSYVPPVAIGEVMRARGAGEVVASGDPSYAAGDLVTAQTGWQTHPTLSTTDPATEIERVPRDVTDPKLMLSVAGITGLTAYFGMIGVAQPHEGDTVLVTAAAGATGSVAGQIARLRGAARVVGTAGKPEKRAWVREIAGFDECVSHYDDNVKRRLREVGPDGYNAVFDNVGGELLDAAIFNIALHGRIALCGSISTGYRPEKPAIGLHYYQRLTTMRARMEGFLVSDHADRYPQARADLLRWVANGDLHVAEDIVEGFEQAPATLQRLFDGKNLGKQLLRVS
jgi:NADPH-dependent curcumin reductase CurA